MSEALNTWRYGSAGDVVRLETSDTLTLETWERLQRVVQILRPGAEPEYKSPPGSGAISRKVKVHVACGPLSSQPEQTLFVQDFGEGLDFTEMQIGPNVFVANTDELFGVLCDIWNGLDDREDEEETPGKTKYFRKRADAEGIEVVKPEARNEPSEKLQDAPAETAADIPSSKPAADTLKSHTDLSTAQEPAENFSGPREDEDATIRRLVMERAQQGSFYAEDVTSAATVAIGHRVYSPVIRRIINQLIHEKALAFTQPEDGARRYHLPGTSAEVADVDDAPRGINPEGPPRAEAIHAAIKEAVAAGRTFNAHDLVEAAELVSRDQVCDIDAYNIAKRLVDKGELVIVKKGGPQDGATVFARAEHPPEVAVKKSGRSRLRLECEAFPGRTFTVEEAAEAAGVTLPSMYASLHRGVPTVDKQLLFQRIDAALPATPAPAVKPDPPAKRLPVTGDVAKAVIGSLDDGDFSRRINWAVIEEMVMAAAKTGQFMADELLEEASARLAMTITRREINHVAHKLVGARVLRIVRGGGQKGPTVWSLAPKEKMATAPGTPQRVAEMAARVEAGLPATIKTDDDEDIDLD